MSERISIPALREQASQKRSVYPQGTIAEHLAVVEISSDVVLALTAALEHAYRGDKETAVRINDNHLCLVCGTWSHADEQLHHHSCPGNDFDFESPGFAVRKGECA